jgi:hypothetical protein
MVSVKKYIGRTIHLKRKTSFSISCSNFQSNIEVIILKTSLTVIFAIVLVLVVFGVANANFWESFLNNLDLPYNSGIISANTILLLIAIGVIGFLGVRRK